MRPLRAAGASGEAAPKKGAKRGSQKKTAGSAAAAAGAPEKGATAVLTPAVEEADAGISVDLEELEDAGQDGFLVSADCVEIQVVVVCSAASRLWSLNQTVMVLCEWFGVTSCAAALH